MGVHIGSGTQNLGLESASQPDLANSKRASLFLIYKVRKQDEMIPKVSAFLTYNSESQLDLELGELELFSGFIINFSLFLYLKNGLPKFLHFGRRY